MQRQPITRYGSDGATGELGEVVRDAMNHAQLIVGDSIALGKLEAQRVAARARSQVEHATDQVKAAVPRVALAAGGAAVGTVGIVFVLVGAFIGLGSVVPSLAARFTIFGAAFLVLAGVFGGLAVKSARVAVAGRPPSRALRPGLPVAHTDASPRDTRAEALRHVAPMHPLV